MKMIAISTLNKLKADVIANDSGIITNKFKTISIIFKINKQYLVISSVLLRRILFKMISYGHSVRVDLSDLIMEDNSF